MKSEEINFYHYEHFFGNFFGIFTFFHMLRKSFDLAGRFWEYGSSRTPQRATRKRGTSYWGTEYSKKRVEEENQVTLWDSLIHIRGKRKNLSDYTYVIIENY